MSDDWTTAAWTVVLAGAAGTYLWRGLGVVLSGRINPEGPVLRWVGAVAYASLAALIARMIVLPAGSLQGTSLAARLIAAALALGVFYLSRRSLLLGVTVGGGALVALAIAGW